MTLIGHCRLHYRLISALRQHALRFNLFHVEKQIIVFRNCLKYPGYRTHVTPKKEEMTVARYGFDVVFCHPRSRVHITKIPKSL